MPFVLQSELFFGIVTCEETLERVQKCKFYLEEEAKKLHSVRSGRQ
jgi:hypothetical protein